MSTFQTGKMLTVSVCAWILCALTRPVLKAVRRIITPTWSAHVGVKKRKEKEQLVQRFLGEGVPSSIGTSTDGAVTRLQTSALARVVEQLTLEMELAKEGYSASLRRTLRQRLRAMRKKSNAWIKKGLTYEQLLLVWSVKTGLCRGNPIANQYREEKPRKKRVGDISPEDIRLAEWIARECPEAFQLYQSRLELLQEVRASRRTEDLYDYERSPFYVKTCHGRPDNLEECRMIGAQFFDQQWFGKNPLTGENYGFSPNKWIRCCQEEGCAAPIPVWLGCARCAMSCAYSVDTDAWWICLQECEEEEHWRQLSSVTRCQAHQGFVHPWIHAQDPRQSDRNSFSSEDTESWD